MIKYLTQDVTTTTIGVIAHGVNCQRAMNSGVAKTIRSKWPVVYERYIQMPSGKTMLGTVHFVNVTESNSLFVANCYTQVFYGKGGKFADSNAIERSLDGVFKFAEINNLPVYMPKIGCGLGGLKWDTEVGPIVKRLAEQYNRVDIFVCEI